MRTITVDILQDEAFNLLKDLEALNVIRLHDSVHKADSKSPKLSEKYKGTMSRQTREEVDQQLSDLRKEWD